MMSSGAKKGQKNVGGIGDVKRGGMEAVTGLFSQGGQLYSTKHQEILYIWYVHYFPKATLSVCVA